MSIGAEKPFDNFHETHPKLAIAFGAGMWAGFAVLQGLKLREARRNGDHAGAIKAGAGFAVSGVVAGVVAAGGENPFRFE